LRPSNPTIAYAAPFALYIVFMAFEGALGLPPQVMHPIRLVVVSAAVLILSRGVLDLKPRMPLATLLLGLAVFAIWVGPDVVFGPGYREHWLFRNSITGAPRSSFDPELKTNAGFIAVRLLTSVVLVPVIEELFWRGWLIRWLVHHDFRKVPVGAYHGQAFWTVAILFAAEHGSYWEVGLAAGVLYNWWILRTKSLADCIWAHAVTNGALALYVLFADRWQYWL
jgi:CAAX prenyl protease-like protein